MAQDNVQLKREEVVGNDVVMEDINPKTSTNSIKDSSKGVPLDQTLAMIKNMINNKLSRVVNSVNGRTGVVVLDANDVGLGNVDDISFGDIKRWVIEYLGDIFKTKRIILREYLSEIHTITGSNDQAYANTPFYTEKGNISDNDYMSYIGYIYWDDTTSMLKEEHLQIRVVGYTDRSLIYNMNAGEGKNFSNGGLAVNIWKGEDALKVMNNVISQTGYTPEELGESGLYIDKSKVVPDVYFFDGVYGTLEEIGGYKYSTNALVYWSDDPNDTTFSNIPLIEIKVNGVDISRQASSGDAPNALHTPQTLKSGDIIISNFVWKDEYINPNAQYASMLYPGMCDSLTSRQPAIGRVTQVADMTTNRPYIVEFFTCKPNVAHGLKLLGTNQNQASTPDDTLIGVDELNAGAKMSDGSNIYGGWTSNISGINILDKQDANTRTGRVKDSPKKLRTIYPTGKSNDILSTRSGMIESESTFILPNFSLCVIPGYEFAEADLDSGSRPISNWNASSPFVGETGSKCFDNYKWNMLGINLEKAIFDTATTSTHAYARNISGLRVNYDTDELHESWFGFGTDTPTSLCDLHSGGLSVNVGDFLGIGTSTELASETPALSSAFYDEGKVNVRIDRLKGLYNSGSNNLGINIATGQIYQPTSVEEPVTWLEGGLKFLPNNDKTPDHGPLAVNTGSNSSGLTVENHYLVNTIYPYGESPTETFEDNVLTVNPYSFRENEEYVDSDSSALEVNRVITSEELSHLVPIDNTYTDIIWDGDGDGLELETMYSTNPEIFDTDHVYIEAGEYFIFKPSDNPNVKHFVPYFRFYSDFATYYKVRAIMNGDSEIPEEPVIDDESDIWKRQCHILITPKNPSEAGNIGEYQLSGMIYQPARADADDLRVPDLNGDGNVDSSEASEIIKIYDAISVHGGKIHKVGDVYYDANNNVLNPLDGVSYWWTDESVSGLAFNGITTITYYTLLVGTKNGDTVELNPLKMKLAGSQDTELHALQYKLADTNRDGKIDSKDAGNILLFYSYLSTGKYRGLSLNEAWRTFLREVLGIYVTHIPGQEGKVLDVLDYTYKKGVRVRYNPLKGLTTTPKYIYDAERSIYIPINDEPYQFDPTEYYKKLSDGTYEQGVNGDPWTGYNWYKRMYTSQTEDTLKTNNPKNSLSIKIADMSSGIYAPDPTKYGGLRFCSEGYLGIRINKNSDFSAVLPNMNTLRHSDDLSIGSKGLHIDSDNVLGIQLSTDGKKDNGELKIDDYGCLRLSSQLRPNTKDLVFSGKYENGSTTEIRYNGGDQITIQLGPGLCFSTSN